VHGLGDHALPTSDHRCDGWASGAAAPISLAPIFWPLLQHLSPDLGSSELPLSVAPGVPRRHHRSRGGCAPPRPECRPRTLPLPRHSNFSVPHREPSRTPFSSHRSAYLQALPNWPFARRSFSRRGGPRRCNQVRQQRRFGRGVRRSDGGGTGGMCGGGKQSVRAWYNC
jgi:hypothetical protein